MATVPQGSGWRSMMGQIKTWAMWLLIGVGAVLVALIKGRRDGRESARQEQQESVAEDAAKASKEIRNVRTEVDSKAVGAADKQLRDDWMREE